MLYLTEEELLLDGSCGEKIKGAEQREFSNELRKDSTIMNAWLNRCLSVCRRMPLPGRLHEGPGPQAPLHPQRVGAQSGVSYYNHLMSCWLLIISGRGEEMVDKSFTTRDSSYTSNKAVHFHTKKLRCFQSEWSTFTTQNISIHQTNGVPSIFGVYCEVPSIFA